MTIKFIEKNIFLLILSICLGLLIVSNYLVFIFLFFSFLCYLIFLNWELKFIIFSICVFIPLSLVNLGPIYDFKFIEILAPVYLLILFFKSLKERKKLFLPSMQLSYMAISVLIVCLLWSYLRNPVSAKNLLGASGQKAGLRSYYTIIVGICIFISTLLSIKNFKVSKNWFFLILCACAFLFGFIRILSFYLNFRFPFLGGLFLYQEAAGQMYSRIGGLSEMSMLGIVALLSYFYGRKRNTIYFLAFPAFLIYLIFSGGRTYFLAVLFVVSLYFVFFNRRILKNVILAFSILALCLLILKLIPQFKGQIDRLFSIHGGFREQDYTRYETLFYYWKVFKQFPLFGKGIGYLKNLPIAYSGRSAFIAEQLISGGHNAYLSVLAIFGLLGLFSFTAILFGSIIQGVSLFKKQILAKASHMDCQRMLLFSILYLIGLSINFISSGSGFNSFELWFVAGLVVGISVSKEKNHD